ncbi:type 4a pilus biogenesis protein PilO [Patescibacteria group bacterium]
MADLKPNPEPKVKKGLNPLYLLLLALIVAIGGYFLFIQPEIDNYSVNGDQITSLKAELQVQQDKKDRANRLIAEYESLPESDPDLQRISRALPLGKNFEELLVTLEGIAYGTGLDLNLSSVRFQDNTETNRALQEITFTLDLVGNSSNLAPFLEQIEKNVRLMDVQSVRVSGGDDAAAQRILLTAQTYYLKSDALLQ